MRRILKMILPLIGIGGFIKYIGLGILSGLFSFLFVNVITRVIGLIIAGRLSGISKEYIIVFASVILLYIWVRRVLSMGIIKLSQQLFWRLRKDVLLSVLNANYQQLSARKTKVHAAILSDVYMLTDASMNIIMFFISLVLGVACLIYLATISGLLFLVTLCTAAVGAVVYHIGSSKNNKEFESYRLLENTFVENFNAILDGYKEIFMEPKKGKAIYNTHITDISNKAYKNNIAAFTGFLSNQITGQILFYILISSVLLVFSVVLKINATDIVSFVFTLLYLLGSIESVMILLPGLMRARIAANHLIELKTELDTSFRQNIVQETNPVIDQFQQIEISELEFQYSTEDKSFAIGPINFSIKRGETIFIYGGNGSGKTTFVHTLLGLSVPASGNIWLNGTLVKEENYLQYRALFSVVFSDFYLFNELLGLEHLDIEKWNYYLHLFEMEGKVKIEGKSFSTTELSAGQRKRLALIAALLEEKPLLVIDEWAADQDPYFRKKFYTEILPILKEEGITIIAITHDDKYYARADRLFKMEYGKLTEECHAVREAFLIS